MSKIEKAIEILTKNPRLSNKEAEKLVVCSERTIARARKSIREAMPKNESLNAFTPDREDSDCETGFLQGLDPVDLLQNKLVQKCRMPNPDTADLRLLRDVLKDTGKLDMKIQGEEDYKLYLSKMSDEELVRISTGKELPNNISQQEDREDSLYQ